MKHEKKQAPRFAKWLAKAAAAYLFFFLTGLLMGPVPAGSLGLSGPAFFSLRMCWMLLWARVCNAGCQADSVLSARRAKARPRRRRKRHKACAGRRGPAAVGGPFGRRYPAGPCRKQRAGRGLHRPCPKQPASPAKGRPLSGRVSDGGPVPAWAGTSYPAGVHHCLCAFGPNRKPRISAVHCPDGPGACFDGAGGGVSLRLSGRQGRARPAAGTAQAGRCRRRRPCAGKQPRAAQTVFAVSKALCLVGCPALVLAGFAVLYVTKCQQGLAVHLLRQGAQALSAAGFLGFFAAGLYWANCSGTSLVQRIYLSNGALRYTGYSGSMEERVEFSYLLLQLERVRVGRRALHIRGRFLKTTQDARSAAAKRARWPACCGWLPHLSAGAGTGPAALSGTAGAPGQRAKKLTGPLPPPGAAYQTRPAAFPAAGRIFFCKIMFICFSQTACGARRFGASAPSGPPRRPFPARALHGSNCARTGQSPQSGRFCRRRKQFAPTSVSLMLAMRVRSRKESPV